MKYKKIFIISLLLITLISLSASFASDIDNNLIDNSSSNNGISENIQNIQIDDTKSVGIFRTNDTDLINSRYNSTDSTTESDLEDSKNLISGSNSEDSQSLDAESTNVESNIQGPNLDTNFTNLNINFTDSNTIFVNASYAGSTESGTQLNPYKSVNTAFSKLLSGYSTTKRNLFIADGSYELSSYLGITRSVNIIGESALNTILSIKTATELFYIRTNDLIINIFNLTLSKGSSDSGGAIYSNRSTVNIVNTIFKENSAIEEKSYYATYYANGGAIFNEAGDMNLYNCSFIDNLAKGDDDAYAAGIYNYLGTVNVLNSQFVNNTINAYYGTGAAIYNYGGFLTVSNSSFINNTIKSNFSLGGAIGIWQGHNTYILNSLFEGNTILGNYTFGTVIASQGILLHAENNTIINNNANGTGFEDNEIYNMNGNINLVNNVIEDNYLKSINNTILLCLEDQITLGNIIDEDIELPSSYDLRDYGLVTHVQDQGTTGSCWAFASLAPLESFLLKTENVSYDFSEQNMRNLMNYYGTNGTDWSDGGNHYMSLAYLLRWSGPVNESDDPFNSYSSRSSTTLDRVKHVQDVIFVPLRLGYTDNDQIKYAILKYGALYTTFCADDYFTYHTNYYSDWSGISNHAVTIVGWDDNYPASKFSTVSPPPGDGAFIIKNSWGTSYGESGYWYISYYDKTLAGYGLDTISAMAYTNVENVSNYRNIYQYDILGNTYESLGYNSNTGWMANQFTATDNSPLSAFGLYSFGDSDIYVEVYVNGELKHTQNARVFGSGYHTIKLNKLVALNAGDLFRINVKITTSNSKFPIAIESQRTGYSSKATASAGQSFISPDGENWYDIAKNTNIIKLYEYLIGNHTLYKTNVCLKAYTAYAGNLVLNSSSNVSLFFKGDTVDVTYKLTNIGDFISDVNISLVLDDSVTLLSADPEKGSFSFDTNTWSLNSLDASESTSLKITILVGENKEVVENFVILNTSGYNAGLGNLVSNGTNGTNGSDISDDLVYYDSLKLYCSGFTKFLEINNVSVYAKSNESLTISLVDALSRPVANKDIYISLEGDSEIIHLVTDKYGNASLVLNLAEGNYTYKVSFDGDGSFESSNLSFDVEVNRKESYLSTDDLTNLVILSKSNNLYNVYLLDSDDNPLVNKTVLVSIELLEEVLGSNNINSNILKEISLNDNKLSNSITSYNLTTNENGIAELSFNLTKGKYKIDLVFNGDDQFKSSDLSFDIEVVKKQAPIVLVGNNHITSSDEFTVCLVSRDFNVLADKTINLILTEINTNTSSVFNIKTDESGVARLNNLVPGNYNILGSLTNDDEYEDLSFSNTLQVSGITTIIDTNDTIKYYGNSTSLLAKLTDSDGNPIIGQTIEITIIDSENNTVEVLEILSDENGLIEVNINNLTEGDYKGVLFFNANGYYASSTENIGIHIISPIIEVNDTIEVESDLEIVLKDVNNNPLEGIAVLVEIVDESNNIVSSFNKTSDSNGKVSDTINLDSGNYTVKTTIGDSQYGSYTKTSTLVINAVDSTNSTNNTENSTDIDNNSTDSNSTNITNNTGDNDSNSTNSTDINGTDTNSTDNSTNTIDNDTNTNTRIKTIILYDDMVTTCILKSEGRIGEYFNVTLVDENYNPIANKPIQIGFNGKIYNKTTDESGVAKLQINLQNPFVYTFAICFLGDDDEYKAAFEIAKITVLKKNTTLTTGSKIYKSTAKTKTLTATLKDAKGNLVASKKISFTVNGKTYTAITNAKGVATVKVSLSKKATYSFTVKFAGDSKYNAISKKGVVKII